MSFTANFHTHTWRCNHASGSEREYIEAAIKGGLKVLGFSDHTPYIFPDGYESGFRMLAGQAEDYVDTLTGLKEEYKDDIEIHIGFETEYYPRFFDTLLRFYEQYPIEYLLLGQHFVGNEIGGDPYSGARTRNRELVTRYVNQSIEALDTGKFFYFAHPDLINYIGDMGPGSHYEREMRRLIRHAVSLDMPLEINLLGIEDFRNYPNEAFWKIAGEEGAAAVIGADAHRVKNVVVPDAIKTARDMMERYGLKDSGLNSLTHIRF